MPIDPSELSPEDKKWLKEKELAAARQAKSKANMSHVAGLAQHDEARRIAEERHRAEVMSKNTTPASLTGEVDDPFEIPDLKISLPEEAHEAAVPTKTKKESTKSADGEITFWVVICDGRPIYAESWDALKGHLKDHNGTWEAIEHRFKLTHKNLLGFFGCQGYKVPEKSVRGKFEVIVQGGKVYRAEQ